MRFWPNPGLVLTCWLAIAGPVLVSRGATPATEGSSSGPKSAAVVAAKVDELIAAELQLPPEALVSTDDETLVRRLTLDLVGRPPSADEVTAYTLDPAADKCQRTVATLLADPAYGENWGRYWRDVMLYRRTDDRAFLAAQSAVDYLGDQFNADARWDTIARELITARGSLQDDGRTILLAAQWGEAVDVAAEVSRVFLGVQIQCAQCHDHKTDRWKREQFHELAAFFPRVTVRRALGEGNPRTFEVVSVERPKKRKKDSPGGEYYMPDLDDPSAEGTLIQPAFFATGKSLPTGTSDAERRGALAEWMTSTSSRWFAKAYVNRIWGELTGLGFYEPLDDLGPERPCLAPETLDYLAEEFIRHQYRVKWLAETITHTKYYRRDRSVPVSSASHLVEANCPQRLRSDQLFDALVSALGVNEAAVERDRRGDAGPRGQLRSPRAQFMQVFGFDPSTPRDEISGSIAQALALMNLPAVQKLISAGPTSPLGQLLASTNDDEQVIVELYLRCLAREPSADEIRVARDYLAQVAERGEAFEDLLWALVNSTEFLHRR